MAAKVPATVYLVYRRAFDPYEGDADLNTVYSIHVTLGAANRAAGTAVREARRGYDSLTGGRTSEVSYIHGEDGDAVYETMPLRRKRNVTIFVKAKEVETEDEEFGPDVGDEIHEFDEDHQSSPDSYYDGPSLNPEVEEEAESEDSSDEIDGLDNPALNEEAIARVRVRAVYTRSAVTPRSALDDSILWGVSSCLHKLTFALAGQIEDDLYRTTKVVDIPTWRELASNRRPGMDLLCHQGQ